MELVYMANVNNPRKYNFSDAELCMFTTNLCTTMARDLDDLSFFGINEDKIDELRALGNDFEVFQPDDSYIGDVMIATQYKNEKMELVKETIRNMAMRVAMKWGENSGQYRKLGLSGMNNFNEDKLLVQARSIYGNISQWLFDLESTGLTQDMLDDFENANNDFEDARDAQNTAINTRDNMTELRIQKGNELYALVATYCDIGKRVYFTKSPAKYDDYLIYGTGGGRISGGGGSSQISAPTNFRYDFAERTVKWNSVSGATSYKLEISDDNTVWDVMYDGENTEFFTGEMLPEHKYLRVRSRNSQGMSVPALYNVVYNYILNGPTNLTHNPALPGFTWDAVTNATAYEVQLRLASATDFDYNLIYFGNDTTLLHGDPVGSYYVRVRSVSATGISGWMLLAYSVGV